ncbi:MAG: AAA family ATPase [Mucispirillum sp.]|nr:AAA family ATPase [Mucispirillum sp.]
MLLTKEQQAIIDILKSTKSNNRIVAVNSVAGAGKTYTAKAIAEALKPANGLYTAYNKAIVADSKKKIKNIDVRTLHSLAYKYSPNKKVDNLTYRSIKEDISYKEKRQIIELLEKFCLSSFLNLDDYANHKIIKENALIDNEILVLAKSYFKQMLEGSISASHNFLLKFLHIKLHTAKKLNLGFKLKYDLVILDECQDTSAVSLEIFKLIEAEKKVILGDTYQNIYSFNNTVNAFELLDNKILMQLTQSFRCRPEVAAVVEKYGKKILKEDFKFTGTENISTEIKTEAYLTRSNLSLIETMHSFHKQSKHYSLTRKIDDIFELAVSIHEANQGMHVTSKKYDFLELEYRKFIFNAKNDITFFIYLEMILGTDSDISKGIKLLQNLAIDNIDIIQVKKQAEIMSDNPNTVLTTAHAFKGLEADIVYINDDLNESLYKADDKKKEFYKKNKKDTKLPLEISNELNLYYVALSRARVKIENISPLINEEDSIDKILNNKPVNSLLEIINNLY